MTGRCAHQGKQKTWGRFSLKWHSPFVKKLSWRPVSSLCRRPPVGLLCIEWKKIVSFFTREFFQWLSVKLYRLYRHCRVLLSVDFVKCSNRSTVQEFVQLVSTQSERGHCIFSQSGRKTILSLATFPALGTKRPAILNAVLVPSVLWSTPPPAGVGMKALNAGEFIYSVGCWYKALNAIGSNKLMKNYLRVGSFYP